MFMYFKFFIHFLIQTSIDSVYIFLIFIKYYLLLLFYIFLFEESIVHILNFNYFLKNYLINKRKIKKKNHINRLKNLDVILILDEEKIIKGKLIKIDELNFKNIQQLYVYITLSLYKVNCFQIKFRVEIDKIKKIKKNNKYKYNLLIYLLKKYSISFKKIDHLVEKHIKDFLFINNND